MNLARFEAHKAALRDAYVGNECDTDEYREAQPSKGLDMLAHALALLASDADVDTQGTQTAKALVDLTARWLDVIEGGGCSVYEGCGELVPVLSLVFDILWTHGEHPYCSDEAELQEYLEQVVLDD